tara:strand:- start:102 stop:287 length:186 start_codon:yes stop_codon:yes gene_type:complete
MTIKVKAKTFTKEKEFLERHNLKTIKVKCGEFYKIFHVYLAVLAMQKRIDELEQELAELKK